jgi:hypothetical protein
VAAAAAASAWPTATVLSFKSVELHGVSLAVLGSGAGAVLGGTGTAGMLGADEDDEELRAEGGEEDQEEEPSMEARLPNMEAESPNLEEELGSVEGFALEMALLTEGSQAPRLAAVDVRIEWLESVLSPQHIRLLT